MRRVSAPTVSLRCSVPLLSCTTPRRAIASRMPRASSCGVRCFALNRKFIRNPHAPRRFGLHCHVPCSGALAASWASRWPSRCAWPSRGEASGARRLSHGPSSRRRWTASSCVRYETHPVREASYLLNTLQVDPKAVWASLSVHHSPLLLVVDRLVSDPVWSACAWIAMDVATGLVLAAIASRLAQNAGGRVKYLSPAAVAAWYAARLTQLLDEPVRDRMLRRQVDGDAACLARGTLCALCGARYVVWLTQARRSVSLSCTR